MSRYLPAIVALVFPRRLFARSFSRRNSLKRTLNENVDFRDTVCSLSLSPQGSSSPDATWVSTRAQVLTFVIVVRDASDLRAKSRLGDGETLGLRFASRLPPSRAVLLEIVEDDVSRPRSLPLFLLRLTRISLPSGSVKTYTGRRPCGLSLDRGLADDRPYVRACVFSSHFDDSVTGGRERERERSRRSWGCRREGEKARSRASRGRNLGCGEPRAKSKSRGNGVGYLQGNTRDDHCLVVPMSRRRRRRWKVARQPRILLSFFFLLYSTLEMPRSRRVSFQLYIFRDEFEIDSARNLKYAAAYR